MRRHEAWQAAHDLQEARRGASGRGAEARREESSGRDRHTGTVARSRRRSTGQARETACPRSQDHRNKLKRGRPEREKQEGVRSGPAETTLGWPESASTDPRKRVMARIGKKVAKKRRGRALRHRNSHSDGRGKRDVLNASRVRRRPGGQGDTAPRRAARIVH